MTMNNEQPLLAALPKLDQDSASGAIDERQTKQKTSLIEQFRKTPIVQLACERAGIGRTTYYRWRKEDTVFAQNADEAMHEGSSLVSDMAESQLLNCIRDKELGAITFWLKHHHPTYSTKLEVTGKMKTEDSTLSPEQEELIKQALKLAGLQDTLNHENSSRNQSL